MNPHCPRNAPTPRGPSPAARAGRGSGDATSDARVAFVGADGEFRGQESRPFALDGATEAALALLHDRTDPADPTAPEETP